jgi:MOSC domain-containing protein YiiM
MNTPSAIKLISVNCGLPHQVLRHGRSVATGIHKEPVKGRVALRKLNLDGDRQADIRVHGGADKAVYCYPLEHYDYWRAELPGRDLPFGMFGENFTIDGLSEDSIHIGDRLSIGSAEVAVTQPRLPCYKLRLRFGLDDMVRRFSASQRTGFYVGVTREGEVGAGDDIRVVARDPKRCRWPGSFVYTLRKPSVLTTSPPRSKPSGPRPCRKVGKSIFGSNCNVGTLEMENC